MPDVAAMIAEDAHDNLGLSPSATPLRLVRYQSSYFTFLFAVTLRQRTRSDICQALGQYLAINLDRRRMIEKRESDVWNIRAKRQAVCTVCRNIDLVQAPPVRAEGCFIGTAQLVEVESYEPIPDSTVAKVMAHNWDRSLVQGMQNRVSGANQHWLS
jgi:hypothetical protein